VPAPILVHPPFNAAGQVALMRLCWTILIAGLLLSPTRSFGQTAPVLPRIYQDCAAQNRAAQARGDEIVVCADRDSRSPYRVPQQREGFDPAGSVQSVSRERHSLYEVGDAGIGSCSPVGPGGITGCMARGWKNKREQYGK
jgi:hypothetical protein